MDNRFFFQKMPRDSKGVDPLLMTDLFSWSSPSSKVSGHHGYWLAWERIFETKLIMTELCCLDWSKCRLVS